MKEQICYSKGYKYILEKSALFEVPELSLFNSVEHSSFQIYKSFDAPKTFLFVKRGYAWDGASGPTVDTPNTIAPSLVHDVIYQAIRLGLVYGISSERARQAADKVMLRMLRERGMGYIRAHLWYRTLRIAGASAASEKSIKLTLLAP